MPAHVPDSRLRGRVRVEKRTGHKTGGDASWRTYWQQKAIQEARKGRNKGAAATLKTFEATHATQGRAPRKAPQPPQTESWWVELSREEFAAEIARRRPVEPPVILPDPDPA